MIRDLGERQRALNPEQSFIVQAPAGSGKTELLIQRYLKLLARVEAPESIVAITFTKKAAGEMRARVVESLGRAAAGETPESEHQSATFALAQDALRRDRAENWQLLQNPARLRIQTIDSLSATITSRMPWLARFGAVPEITEKAGDLYNQAARNTLRMVGEEERAGADGPLSRLLLHLDNSFGQAEKMIARMLEKRDQWLRLTSAGGDLASVRPHLESTLAQWIEAELGAIGAMLPPDVVRDLVWLLELDHAPGASIDDLPDWLRLSNLVLTSSDGKPRKRMPPEVLKKDRWDQLMAGIAAVDGLAERLKYVRKLPVEASFSLPQWEAMEAFIQVLPRAVQQLWLVFRERGQVDFAELSIQALHALGHLDAPTDLALSLGERIEHLLIDEFQDTSFTQFELLRRLTAGWEPGDGRTLFLVGDPMQSIYRFREADVSLFLRARREGIGAIALEPLTLTVNFRSDPELVEWVNGTFLRVMPPREDIIRGAVAYTPSIAHRSSGGESARPVVHAFFDQDTHGEAEAVLAEVAAAKPGESIAILVRARSHLTKIVTGLRARGIPFQAIEIDPLGERPVVQDLMALTFALLHLADRIAWLAVLRAPWCALGLAELDAIAGAEHKPTIWDLLQRPGLDEKTARVVTVLSEALDLRGRVPLRTLVEGTWIRLGGPACVRGASDLSDASAYFDLLDGLEQAGDLADFGLLRDQVAKLFAQPSAEADGRLQVMTIHRAKGLEFDTVIVPGLGQPGRKDDEQLLIWQEQEGELLLAAMSAKGNGPDPIYDYLAHLEKEKIHFESARLLYVAVTRARKRLHLLGRARTKEKGDQRVAAESGSFLRLLWPVVGHHYLTAAPAAYIPEAARPVRMLRSLPAGWRAPAPPPPVQWLHATGHAETGQDEDRQEVMHEWASDTARHAGTVLHVYLRRIAEQGLEAWDAAVVMANRPAFHAMLRNLGVPAMELPEGQERVEKALLRTLRDERGRWILGRHRESEAEVQLTGMLDGKVHSAVLDRTFVDEADVRWIVDYKASAHEGGDVETFLAGEKERHQAQLERYARLIAQREERTIRLGLYFPLLGAWQEWAAPTVKRRQASLFASLSDSFSE